jgi:hypothetical protein
MNCKVKQGLFAFIAASLSMAALAGQCQGRSAIGDADPGAWRSKHISVYLHHGYKTKSLPFAWTPLDKPITFNCTSVRGCLLAYDQEVFGSVGFEVCLVVDGVAAHPPCGSVALMHQDAHLTTGTHTIQTLVEPGSTEGGDVNQWEFGYTIYSHRK